MNTKTQGSVSGAISENYMDEALSVLRRLGITVINYDVGQWLTQQKDAGVPVGSLAERWKAPENAQLANEARSLSRVRFIIGELESKVARLKDSDEVLVKKINAEGTEKLVELAAENAETLVEVTARKRVFTTYLNAMKGRFEGGQPASVIFTEMSAHVHRDLATSASNLRSRSTSWLENARVLAKMAALGDVGSVFVDAADY